MNFKITVDFARCFVHQAAPFTVDFANTSLCVLHSTLPDLIYGISLSMLLLQNTSIKRNIPQKGSNDAQNM